MNKLEEMISASKLAELMTEERKKRLLIGLAIIGAIAAVAVIAYLVYRFFVPDYMDDFEDEFDEEFDDDFFDDDENEYDE